MSTCSDPAALRALLVGLGPTTASALHGLARELTVCGLIRPGADGVVETARRTGAEIVSDASVRALRDAVDRLRPDVVVVSSYDRVLPADLLERVPFLNVHYGALPRMRGRAVVNWSVILGHPVTAITLHALTPGLDDGGILHQEMVPIGPEDTVATLYERLNHIQDRAIGPAARRRALGEGGTPQVGEPSYASTRVPGDGRIDWTRDAPSIERLVRGLGGPFPAAFTYLGLTRVEVHAATAEPLPEVWEGVVPGRVHSVDRARGEVLVFAGAGVVRLRTVSVADAGPVPAATVITSTRQTLGLDLDAVLDRLQQLESVVRALRPGTDHDPLSVRRLVS